MSGAWPAARQERRQTELAALRSALPIGNALPIYFGRRDHFSVNCSGTNSRAVVTMDLALVADPGRVSRGTWVRRAQEDLELQE
jgi:hypothetical protein